MGEYATEKRVREVESRITKLEWSHEMLVNKLDDILKVLVRIAWLLITPIILAVGYGAVQLASNSAGFWK